MLRKIRDRVFLKRQAAPVAPKPVSASQLEEKQRLETEIQTLASGLEGKLTLLERCLNDYELSLLKTGSEMDDEQSAKIQNSWNSVHMVRNSLYQGDEDQRRSRRKWRHGSAAVTRETVSAKEASWYEKERTDLMSAIESYHGRLLQSCYEVGDLSRELTKIEEAEGRVK